MRKLRTVLKRLFLVGLVADALILAAMLAGGYTYGPLVQAAQAFLGAKP